MTTRTYQIETGRKYDKVICTNGAQREAAAFIDKASGTWYVAKSWSSRGYMMTSTQRAAIEAGLGA